jgi:SAM-dependent methyltransferase
VSGFDPDTLAFYAAEAPVYLSSRPDGVARHLPDFLSRLCPGSKILELGCGGGTDAAYMLEMGFAVDPTDGTSAIAALAQDRLKMAVRVMRFDEIDAVAEYDAVVAMASLLHVPFDALPMILAKIYTAMRPGGWHIATFKGEGMDSSSRDVVGRYYNYPSAESLETSYRTAGDWSLLDVQSYVGGGHFGKQGPWHAITVQKPEA